LHLLGASVEPGFALVADAVGLEAQIGRADVVITGEGRLDGQTQYGKTAAGVAAMARSQGKRVIAIAGQITSDDARAMFDVAIAASPEGMPLDLAMGDAPTLVRAATARAVESLT
jgi:glycerate kinase